jgi:hypothetical protein
MFSNNNKCSFYPIEGCPRCFMLRAALQPWARLHDCAWTEYLNISVGLSLLCVGLDVFLKEVLSLFGSGKCVLYSGRLWGILPGGWSRISGLASKALISPHCTIGRHLFQQFGTQIWVDADPLLHISKSSRFRFETNNLPFDLKTVDSNNHTLGSVPEGSRAPCFSRQNNS